MSISIDCSFENRVGLASLSATLDLRPGRDGHPEVQCATFGGLGVTATENLVVLSIGKGWSSFCGVPDFRASIIDQCRPFWLKAGGETVIFSSEIDYVEPTVFFETAGNARLGIDDILSYLEGLHGPPCRDFSRFEDSEDEIDEDVDETQFYFVFSTTELVELLAETRSGALSRPSTEGRSTAPRDVSKDE